MGRKRWEGGMGRLEIINTGTKEKRKEREKGNVKGKGKEKKRKRKRKKMNKIIYMLYKIQDHRITNTGKGL